MPDKSQTDDVATMLEKRRRLGVGHHRKLVAETLMNLAFLSGNQWMSFSISQGLQAVPNTQKEPRVVDNRMLHIYRMLMQLLFQEQPTITAFGGGVELSDDEVAAVVSRIATFWRTKNGWKEAEKELGKWMLTSGIAFMRPCWRQFEQLTEKRKKRRYLEEPKNVGSDEQPILSFVDEYEEDEPYADMQFDVLEPTSTYWFPTNASRWSQVEAVMTVSVVSLEKLRLMMGKNISKDELTEIQLGEWNLSLLDGVEKFISPDFGTTARGAGGHGELEEKYAVIEYMERPTVKTPKGRYIVSGGGKVYRDDPLPYLDSIRRLDPTDSMNWTMGVVPWVASTEIAGSLSPVAPMTTLRSYQTRLNGLLTDADINRRTFGRNKLLVERGTLSKEQWSGKVNEIIEYEPGTRLNPQLIPAAPLAGIEAEIREARESMYAVAGIPEMLRGVNPTQVRSAFHYQALKEDGTTLLAGLSQTRADHHQAVATVAFGIARPYLTKERVFKMYGRDRAGRVLNFISADLRYDVQLAVGSLLARNHAAQEAKLVELLQYGAFVDKEGRPDVRALWQMLELGTVNPDITHESKVKTRASNENVAMLQGQPVQPFEHEAHETHIEEHLGFMSSEQWYRSGPDVQSYFLAHIQAHVDFMLASVPGYATNQHFDPLTQPVAAEDGGDLSNNPTGVPDDADLIPA